MTKKTKRLEGYKRIESFPDGTISLAFDTVEEAVNKVVYLLGEGIEVDFFPDLCIVELKLGGSAVASVADDPNSLIVLETRKDGTIVWSA